MRLQLPIILLALGIAGCPSDNPNPNHRPDFENRDVGALPTIACPQDPDCGFNAESNACEECPDYWVCDTLSAEYGNKRCTNPGPDLPDGSGDWECRDENGETICEREGNSLPDGGGGNPWNCELRGEFVVCSNPNPSYPDEDGNGPWNCYFAQEFRICEDSPPDMPSSPGTPGGSGDRGDEWECRDIDGRTVCDNDTVGFPDERAWVCIDVGEEIRCQTPGGRGDLPDGGGGNPWNCELRGEFVVCSADDPGTPDGGEGSFGSPSGGGSLPDGGGGNPWNCELRDEFVRCSQDASPPDMDPPTMTEIDYPDNEDVGEPCPGPTTRWCDDDVFCSWGKQECVRDRTSPTGYAWGRCVEPEMDGRGLVDRPSTQCACRFFYFNFDCCEDQEDRNGDGLADCFIPEERAAPVCESDGSTCSTCDHQVDCGGENDLCLFRRDGYAFCGTACERDRDCGAGYHCERVRTGGGGESQCVPDSGSCE